MAVLLSSPYQQFFDDDGNPLNGGKVYTYAAGTTTPKQTFTNSDGDVPLANPVILDSAGRTAIWLEGAYKIEVRDSLDNIIRTVDDVTAGGLLADGDYGDIVASSNGATLTIDNDAVTNAKLAEMAANTIKVNATTGTANPTDVTIPASNIVGRLQTGNITAIPNGGIITQIVETFSATAANTTTAAPYDNTKLQNTEGAEFTPVATAFTPTRADSTLLLEYFGNFSHSGSNEVVTMGAFVDSTADAIAALVENAVASKLVSCYLAIRIPAVSTTQRTYKMRYGPATGTAYINSDSTGAKGGGTILSGIRITEFVK